MRRSNVVLVDVLEHRGAHVAHQQDADPPPQPRIGETAAVIEEVDDGIYLVERCTDDGRTLWIAFTSITVASPQTFKIEGIPQDREAELRRRLAGTERLIEVHGSIDRSVCMECGGKVSIERVVELLAQYAKSVQASFAEVENALIRIRSAAAQHATQAAQVASTERTLALAETRYRNGYSSFLEVLDAQRTLFSAQDQLAQLRLNRLEASVSLFKALGGGWTRG